jgi:hypothetical protein
LSASGFSRGDFEGAGLAELTDLCDALKSTAATRGKGVPEVAGEIDPTGRRKDALDSFLEARLREGFAIETHTATHAIIAKPNSLLDRLRGRASAMRYVVSVDEHGEVTMAPAEPKRS